uniref:Plastid-lipid-associated protein n=1 Tax=Rhizophora mucronata TaxID=61149 RepID=A0A2P2K0S9_RHIMU
MRRARPERRLWSLLLSSKPRTQLRHQLTPCLSSTASGFLCTHLLWVCFLCWQEARCHW